MMMITWKDVLNEREIWDHHAPDSQSYARILKLRNISQLRKEELIDMFQYSLFAELFPQHEAINYVYAPTGPYVAVFSVKLNLAMNLPSLCTAVVPSHAVQ